MALRRIAAEQGIPAFGTYALLAALTETDIISDTTIDDRQKLADANVVELP